MMYMKKTILAAIFFAALSATAMAQDATLRLAKVLGDNMVIQRDKPVKIWGWAKPGEKVTVAITTDKTVGEPACVELAPAKDDGEYRAEIQYVEHNAKPFAAVTKTAVAGADGAWETTFPAMVASYTPKYVIARAGDQAVGIRNVLVGEVWICSGQSNMDWPLFHASDIERPSANLPALRYLKLDQSWYKPKEDLDTASWKVFTPELKTSAIPFVFGMRLQRYLNVPVGIINNARGGTTGQTWCLRSELDTIDEPHFKKILKAYDADSTKWESEANRAAAKAEWEATCDALRAKFETDKAAYAKAKAAYDAQDPATRKKSQNPREPRLRLPKAPIDPREGRSPPAGMFNAVVYPLRKLGIRGVLYHQGENNNFGQWTQYEHTFPRVVDSFRKAFGDEALPFGIMTMPGWGHYGSDPEVATVADGYAIVRDIHHRTAKAKANCDVISIYDLGNSYIHPSFKFPMATRAVRWALAKVYDKSVMWRGPVLKRVETIEVADGPNMLRLFWDPDPIVRVQVAEAKKKNPTKTLATWLGLPVAREGNAEFKGFIIAGADRKWYPAKVKVNASAYALDLYHPLVPEPVAVRHGWAQWPTSNMVGRSRLPVPQFRTDDWPLPVIWRDDPDLYKKYSETIDAAKAAATKQALERKVREAIEIDLPALDRERYLSKLESDKAKFLQAKADRIRATLDDLESDLVKSLYAKTTTDLPRKIEAVREVLADLEAEIARLAKPE